MGGGGDWSIWTYIQLVVSFTLYGGANTEPVPVPNTVLLLSDDLARYHTLQPRCLSIQLPIY
jgi:hypothetical protein